MRIRLSAYRAAMKMIERCVLPFFLSKETVSAIRANSVSRIDSAQLAKNDRGQVRRIWFHAASVGELESLLAVISLWSDRPGESIITVFSESAKNHVERIKKEFSGKQGKLLYCGYSPFEGAWLSCLSHIRPDVFVTAKYEAWPELWSSLSQLGISLVIVGAKARRSLVVAKKACRVLGSALPKMLLLTATAKEIAELRRLFPSAKVLASGDPRWDRVFARSKVGNARAKQLISVFKSLPRPWGVLGSVWPQDMEYWYQVIGSVKGSLWIVPHQIRPEFISSLCARLSERGYRVLRSSAIIDVREGIDLRSGDCVVVDEMGFLLELYSEADWAYVGGGFTHGVHSTIEPAIHGLPVCIGPKNAEKFPEIEELREIGQLNVITCSRELSEWLDRILKIEGREQYRLKAQERFGSSKRVLSEIMGAALCLVVLISAIC